MEFVPCPHCGRETDADADFCCHCGGSFDGDGCDEYPEDHYQDDFDDDYDEFIAENFPDGNPTNTNTPPFWRWVSVLLLLGFLCWLLSAFRIFTGP